MSWQGNGCTAHYFLTSISLLINIHPRSLIFGIKMPSYLFFFWWNVMSLLRKGLGCRQFGLQSKQRIHIIYFEPGSKRLTSSSIHELNVILYENITSFCGHLPCGHKHMTSIVLEIVVVLVHTGNTDFVSDFVSDYFTFCTCAESTSSLHFSHFVLNCQKYLLDIYYQYCWIYM